MIMNLFRYYMYFCILHNVYLNTQDTDFMGEVYCTQNLCFPDTLKITAATVTSVVSAVVIIAGLVLWR